MKKVLVIVPVHNEADALEVVLPQLKQVCVTVEGAVVDIIVMCNGSTDGSADVAEAHGVRAHRQQMPGKPQAVKTAFTIGLSEGYDRMIVFDGDGQHTPEAIPLMLTMLEQYWIVKGSRYLATFTENSAPLDRMIVTAAMRGLIQEFTRSECTDPPCGLVGLRFEVARALVPVLDWHEEWEIELLFALAHVSEFKRFGLVEEFAIPAIYDGLPGLKQKAKYDPDVWEARLSTRLVRQAKSVHHFVIKYCRGKT